MSEKHIEMLGIVLSLVFLFSKFGSAIPNDFYNYLQWFDFRSLDMISYDSISFAAEPLHDQDISRISSFIERFQPMIEFSGNKGGKNNNSNESILKVKRLRNKNNSIKVK